MLITGIRHAISSELDTHRSAIFMRYLMHYLKMCAFLGVMLPIVIGAYYFFDTQMKEETVTNKYYQVMDNLNQIEYYFFTDSYHFLSDIIFYENTNVADRIIFHRTPILKTVTNVTNRSDRFIYTCKPSNIYAWPLIIVALTFVCSVIFITQTWSLKKRRESIKYDSKVNLGIINALLCVMTIIAAFFRIMY